MRSKRREPVPLCMVQNHCQSKRDSVFQLILQSSRQAKASTLLHSAPETLSVRGQDVYRMAIEFQGNKNTVLHGPIGVARSASTGKCTDSLQSAIDATGLYQKMANLMESVDQSKKLLFKMDVFLRSR